MSDYLSKAVDKSTTKKKEWYYKDMKIFLMVIFFLGSTLIASAQFVGTQAEYDALCARIGPEQCAMIMFTPSTGGNNGTQPQAPCLTGSAPTTANPTINPIPPCPPGASCNTPALDCQTLVRMGLMSDCGNTAANLNRGGNSQSGYALAGALQPGDNPAVRAFMPTAVAARAPSSLISRAWNTLTGRPTISGFARPSQATLNASQKANVNACIAGHTRACLCIVTINKIEIYDPRIDRCRPLNF